MAVAFYGYQSLVENSPDAISLINKDREIVYGSPAHLKLLGYRKEELVGRDYIEMLHPEDRAHSGSLLQEVAILNGDTRSWDARIRRKDGTYCWVESTASNLIDDSRAQSIVIHQRDIHARMEAQEKSKAHAEELIVSNLRMEEFAYTVAHDLREPLRAISVYTQILFAKVQLSQEEKEMAQFVIAGASRMATMITDLLTFARSGMPAPPVLLSLEDVAAQASKNLALELKESGALLTIDPMPNVYSDEVHLVRIFQNLISNAIKYRSQKPLEILISSEAKGHDWVIKVRDNGQGIAPEYKAKIFLPFVRLGHKDVPGTGLGLAVCKKSIEGLGGTIWTESQVDVGSTFAFTIPAAVVKSDAATSSHA